MGRTTSITPEQVHALAHAIRAEGGTPTLRAVRERLGTGSMGTIARHLQTWQAQQTRQATADLALPPALQRALLDFMGTELAAARAPLEAELVEAQQATTDLAAENERLGSQIDAQRLELESVAAERAAADGRSEQLSDDLAALKAEAAELRGQLATAQLQAAVLASQLSDAQRRADAATQLVEQERSARVLATERAERSAVEAAELRGQLAATGPLGR